VRTLVLDAEALSALAEAPRRPKAARRAQAVLTAAHNLRALVRIPAPVLAEVCRGAARDAAIHRVLRQVGRVVPTGRAVARRAGALLFAAKLDSSHAIDAFVVATAVALGGALVATSDPEDIAHLASGHPNVTTLALA
jgi:predicted nucleic acid-binding protein